MSPRPRKATDNDVFAAAARVMQRVGPTELTLAAIAAEAGLTAGALVQRFGSKRDLLRNLSARFANATDEVFAPLMAQHASPLAVIRAYARCHAQLAASPDALSRNLAYLQLDLTDPELHRALLKHARVIRTALVRLIQAATDAGELVGTVRPSALARIVEVTLSGSMMTWAIYREGPAAHAMLADLNAVLEPYVSSRVQRGRQASRRPR
jgi:AcrR family transcriptional regulator